MIIRFSAYDTPTQIYSVSFKSYKIKESLSELTSHENLSVKLIEEVKFINESNNQIEKDILDFLPGIKKETISLENRAEAHFIYSTASVFEEGKGKRPMVLIIHGGPFVCAN